MNDVEQLLSGITPEVYERLRTAVELGKWDDGTLLSPAQKESTMQLVILYQAHKLDQNQHLTINAQGNITHLSKTELKRQLQEDAGVIASFSEQDV